KARIRAGNTVERKKFKGYRSVTPFCCPPQRKGSKPVIGETTGSNNSGAIRASQSWFPSFRFLCGLPDS
ncbi:MAG: hypothetical protein AB8B42_10085, partial [Prochlorococcus sp.]